MQRLSLPIIAASVLLLSACSSDPSGEYIGKPGSFLDKIVFKSAGQVEVIRSGGTRVGTYQVDGDYVIILIGNDQERLTIDDEGCMGGGSMTGTYCKG